LPLLPAHTGEADAFGITRPDRFTSTFIYKYFVDVTVYLGLISDILPFLVYLQVIVFFKVAVFLGFQFL